MSSPEIQSGPAPAENKPAEKTVFAEPRLMGQGHPPRPVGVWDLNPGDAVWPDSAGAGENLCPDCSGEGKYQGEICHTCGGTGLVMVPVNGGG